MIISHPHRFVFVRPMKVGGTSMMHALLDALGVKEGDPRHGGDIEQWQAHGGIVGAVNHFGNPVAGYTFVTVMRNPWDRMVSHFFFKHQKMKEKPLKRSTAVFRDWITSGRFLADNQGSIFDTSGSLHWRGFPVVDLVVKYEFLEQGVKQMAQHLNLPFQLDLSNYNMRRDHRPGETRDYRMMYDDETWQIVKIAAARDIVAYGYDDDKPHGDDRALLVFDNAHLRQKILDVRRRAAQGAPKRLQEVKSE